MPTAGTSQDFPSSGGAVGLVGSGSNADLVRGAGTECVPMIEGLAITRSTFSNNTGVVNGESLQQLLTVQHMLWH